MIIKYIATAWPGCVITELVSRVNRSVAGGLEGVSYWMKC